MRAISKKWFCSGPFLVLLSLCSFFYVAYDRSGWEMDPEEEIPLQRLPYDHPIILRLIKRFLDPPSAKDYNLMADKSDAAAAEYNSYQSSFESYVRNREILERLFSDQKNGFFFEAGALDGEFLSNSLYLERILGWNGILIEPDRKSYNELRKKNRRCWSSNTCISPHESASRLSYVAYKTSHGTNRATQMLVRAASNLIGVRGIKSPTGGIMGEMEDPIEVNCFPFASYLLALNKLDVDYVSLDVEGAESDILLRFPWHRINVTVWTIEHRRLSGHFDRYAPQNGTSAGEENIRYRTVKNDTAKGIVYVTSIDPNQGKDEGFVRFMEMKGYELVDYWSGDYTFVKKYSNIWKKIKEVAY